MLLQVKDLEISYGRNKPVLSEVSFDLKQGEVLAIVGESGSGKTTVIRAIQNCLPIGGKVNHGEIIFKGKDLLKQSTKEKRNLCGTEISMIFQDCGNMLNPVKTVGEQIYAYLKNHGIIDKKEAHEQAIKMIERVKLPNPENILRSFIFELSGGMRQRVGIAMALALNPCLLLADEPTSALDVTTQAQIIKDMMQMKEELGVSIIIVTHNIGVAAHMADKIMIMKEGQIVDYGSKEQIINGSNNSYTRLLLDAIPKLGDKTHKGKTELTELTRADVLLETKDLTKEFAISENAKIVACNNISLDVYRGKTLGIVGESGSGKSTLVKMIVQMYKPTSGSVYFMGEDITKLSGNKARQNRRRIQMVFQDPTASFNPKMLIKDIICEPLQNFNLIKRDEVQAKAEEMLQQVGLPVEFANRYPHSMSGGQRQRVAIARALVLNPEIIIFDEATSALDVSVQKSIIDLLKDLQKKHNITYIFICHDLALANQVSDEIAIMYLGSVMEKVSDICEDCLHPYSKSLLDSVFDVNYSNDKRQA
ncbi:MAG TPA: ABC transporter ATP-binding protein [Candidatus Avacidaminococcus intestinavium]|uniref:ABC transporter ATP-binding protein n=1 Tax=Candidatus Avacidaminococcus intestinavium TaxID=2840684 RepID=A0A9D1MPU9_9FIRM|nr:ABC transporter ATP-binding protein [Candidatus Avacidaminococcus intestinavium]